MNALIDQYNRIKQKYPDAILLFRVGDFYETFGRDAEIIATVLKIILVTPAYDNGIKNAGFPFHALDPYLQKLVKAGYRVALCEQLEDPKKANGTVKRGVTDFLTAKSDTDEKATV